MAARGGGRRPQADVTGVSFEKEHGGAWERLQPDSRAT